MLEMEKPKTYCDKEGGCYVCDLLLCDGSPKKRLKKESNMLLKTEVEWHDLRLDPDDLPGEEEGVFVTVETFDGEKRVWSNVFYDNESECWCTDTIDEYGRTERVMVWYKVIGWAYNPPPMPDYMGGDVYVSNDAGGLSGEEAVRKLSAAGNRSGQKSVNRWRAGLGSV